ncbi:hypothetical protein [uncultured Ornithinimicrobium sp.]|uniref:hypothetical protein n=1 Tax=uncultured Ornithinimicrobium sp. TaxID=259307 RepID=UPI0025943698|nr:hypothetical protein [uncultured Ornithinimicrobium sp.]
MDAAGARRRVVAGVSAGALAGVLAAGMPTAAAAGPVPTTDVVDGVCGSDAGDGTGPYDQDRAMRAWADRLTALAEAHLAAGR